MYEKRADEASEQAYRQFRSRWEKADRAHSGDMGAPTSSEVWAHAWRAALAFAAAQKEAQR